MELKKLKVATSRMAGYTGVLGVVRFVDGVSTEYLPRHIRDRMAASMEFIEIDRDGAELPAGAQYRMIRESAERAPIMAPLERQTEADKKKETVEAALAQAVNTELHTKAELMAFADKGGIKAVRAVAERWNVKHRSIPVLIEMILEKQDRWIAARNKRLADKIEAELSGDKVIQPDIEKSAEPALEIETDLPADDENQMDLFASGVAKAAASGDLSAALNSEEPPLEMLYGSSVLASTYEIGGRTVQLGEIVAAAHKKSGSTVEEWNSLCEGDREDLLRLELDSLLKAAE